MQTRNISLVLAIGAWSLCQTAFAASTDRASVSTAEIEGNGDSNTYAISADGRFVAFWSSANNLVTGDTNNASDVFVRDRQTGTTERVSVSSAEAQGDFSSTFGAITPDGRFVAFYSSATNLVASDTNSATDVFVRDRQAGTTVRVSVNNSEKQGNATSDWPWISASGRFVVFRSVATNLVGGDSNASADIFVRDRLLGTTERASVSTAGAQANADSSVIPWISADGRFVAFASVATNLVPDDTNGWRDTFVRDRQIGTTERVSLSSAEVEGNAPSGDYAAISADGRYVVFQSNANNLLAGDTNNLPDIFVRDRQLGTTGRASVSSSEVQANATSGPAVTISPDGRFVFFPSSASNLVAGDTNGPYGGDSFLRDRKLGITERLSVSTSDVQGNGPSGFGGISPDARFAAFVSAASTLVSNDTNNRFDAFVRDRGPQPKKPVDDLLIDFGANGLQQRMNNASWLKVHRSSPIAIASGDLDGNDKTEAIASFSGLGLLARYNNFGAWVTLHAAAPTLLSAGDFNGNGLADLVADLGSSGLWVRYDNSDAWRKVNASTSEALLAGDLNGNGKDELVADLGAGGLWARYDDATWIKLNAANPTHVAVGDLDGNGKGEVIAALGATGIWVRYNSAGPFVKVDGAVAQDLLIDDLNGGGKSDLVVDRGSNGLWIRYDNVGAWQRVDSRSPLRMVSADLDQTGEAELIASFSGVGIQVRYNNAGPWQQLQSLPEQGMVSGSFD